MSIRATAQSLDRLSDGQLVQRAQAGEQDAFAELYERYFDRVYDFLTRMMRNRGEAEDVTQDTFIRAMSSIGNLQSTGSFKSWIFTIARNTALNRIERNQRSRPMPTVDGDSGESLELHIIDTDRLGHPEEAAQATVVSSLVWEAAAGLNAKQYSLLDLHIRQGLDSGDIADMLNINRNNAYVMLNRMKAALAETVTAYIMMNEGRLSCPDLDSALNRASIKRFSPAARRVVTKHISACDSCQARQSELVSPVAILGAFVPVPAAPGVKDAILDSVLAEWPPAGIGGEGSTAGGTRFDPQLITSLAAIVTGLAILAGLLAGTLFGAGGDSVTGAAETGLTVVFTGPSGEPLSQVGIQLFSLDDAAPAFQAVTGDDGTVRWPNALAGGYDLVIGDIPDGIDIADAERVLAVTIDEGEHLVLTATLRPSN